MLTLSARWRSLDDAMLYKFTLYFTFVWWLLQSRQQLESDAVELRRQVDSAKDQLVVERKKQSTYEQRISELSEKLRSAENAVSTTSSQLVHESSSLEVLNKTKVRTFNNIQHTAVWKSLITCFDMCSYQSKLSDCFR